MTDRSGRLRSNAYVAALFVMVLSIGVAIHDAIDAQDPILDLFVAASILLVVLAVVPTAIHLAFIEALSRRTWHSTSGRIAAATVAGALIPFALIAAYAWIGVGFAPALIVVVAGAAYGFLSAIDEGWHRRSLRFLRAVAAVWLGVCLAVLLATAL